MREKPSVSFRREGSSSCDDNAIARETAEYSRRHMIESIALFDSCLDDEKAKQMMNRKYPGSSVSLACAIEHLPFFFCFSYSCVFARHLFRLYIMNINT